MAKVKFTTQLDGHVLITTLFSMTFSLELAPSDEETATYQDSGSGTQLILEGSGFEYDGETMTAGTITRIVISDAEGGRFLTASQGEWDAEKLMEAFDSNGIYGIPGFIFKGKDKIIANDGSQVLQGYDGRDTLIGGKRGDWLEGGKGNDTMTGGAGSDRFDFFANGGRDVITDFDAVGGGKEQDYLRLQEGLDYHEKHTKDGLLLKFETGERLLLLDVDKLDKHDVSFL